MKRTIRLFAIIALMITSVSAFAQKPFAGNITFEMSAEGCSDPNIAAQLAEQTREYTVMGNSYRMDISDQGLDVSIITNGNSKTVTVVLNIQGYGKYYNQLTEEGLKSKMGTTKFDFNYTEEAKVIAGYNCKKVVLKITDLETDEEDEVILWVTSELGLGDDINFSSYPGLKGYPLSTEMTTDINGEEVTIVTTATKVVPNKKVKATNFLLPSDAVSYKEAPEDIKPGVVNILKMVGGLIEEEE